MSAITDYLRGRGWSEGWLFVHTFQRDELCVMLFEPVAFEGYHPASGPIRREEWSLGTRFAPGLYKTVASGFVLAELEAALQRGAQ